MLLRKWGFNQTFLYSVKPVLYRREVDFGLKAKHGNSWGYDWLGCSALICC